MPCCSIFTRCVFQHNKTLYWKIKQQPPKQWGWRKNKKARFRSVVKLIPFLRSRSTLGHSRSHWGQSSSSHAARPQEQRNRSRISTVIQPLRQNAAEVVDLTVDEDGKSYCSEKFLPLRWAALIVLIAYCFVKKSGSMSESLLATLFLKLKVQIFQWILHV